MVIDKYLAAIIFVLVPIPQPASSPIASSLKKTKAPPPSVVMELPPPPPNKGTCYALQINNPLFINKKFYI